MIDKIDLSLDMIVGEDGAYPSQVIMVNGKLFKGYCEILSFFEDSHQRCPYEPRISWTYLDSCSCGAAGCAGIWEGIYLHRKKGVYYYSARKRGGYRGGILGSGKLSLRVSEKNILAIRKTIRDFYREFKDVLSQDYDNIATLRYLGILEEEEGM